MPQDRIPEFILTPFLLRSLPEQSRMLRIRGIQSVNAIKFRAETFLSHMLLTDGGIQSFGDGARSCTLEQELPSCDTLVTHGMQGTSEWQVVWQEVEPLAKRHFKALDLKPHMGRSPHDFGR